MRTPLPRSGPMLALLSAWSADILVRSYVGWPKGLGNWGGRVGFESLLRTGMSALRWWRRATPVLAVLSVLSACAGPGFIGRAAPEWDALFQRESGWIGADGDYSIPLDRDTTLWLFSDTFVGRVKDGKRLDARMINNSIALQRGTNAPEFFYGTATNGQPASFITAGAGLPARLLLAGPRPSDRPRAVLLHAARRDGQHRHALWIQAEWMAGLPRSPTPTPRRRNGGSRSPKCPAPRLRRRAH